MSQVIVGIVGIILFVGLAVAGTSYLGPQAYAVTQSAQASLVVSELSSVSTAIQTREGDTGEATLSRLDTSFLAPRYLAEAPRNVTGGPAPVLLDVNGLVSGIATFAALPVEGANSASVCAEAEKLGGGTGVLSSRAAPPPGRMIGAFRVDHAVSAGIPVNSCLAFAVIP